MEHALVGHFLAHTDPVHKISSRELGAEPSYSEETAQEIDEEIYRLIDDAHERAAKCCSTTRQPCVRSPRS